MAKPTKYDVMIAGRKVGGGAQRRTKHGFLHQRSIALSIPSQDFLDDVLLPDTCVTDAIRKNSDALLGSASTLQNLVDARKFLQDQLIKAFQRM